jgi:protein dithiol oxidoreductase (disulfide-forming)
VKKLWITLLALVCMPLVLSAQPNAGFDEGIDYQKLSRPQPTATPGKIEVVELFWYGCPSCFAFKPHLSAWLRNKPEDVELVRIPATLNPRWVLHARAFYTAELLGVLEQMHDQMFHAIHVERRPLDDEAQLTAFFAEHGVAEEEFRDAFHSFAVESKLRRAAALTQRYGVTGVPAVVINGKYRTDGSMAGGFENVLRIIDHLVAEERES